MSLRYPEQRDPGKAGRGVVVALNAFLGFVSYFIMGWVSLVVMRIWVLPVLMGISIVVAILGKWRGFILGMVIGVGLTLLAWGLCLTVFRIHV